MHMWKKQWYSTDAETVLAVGSVSLITGRNPYADIFFYSLENMKGLFTNYWRETGDRYCTLFLLFSHLILVVSTSLSCSRHCCTTPPPPERMRSLASQQIMWHTRVLAEDRAMSHKGPLRVPDYDNIRKRRKEEVSAGSWQASEALGQSHTYLFEKPGCHPNSKVTIMENGWQTFYWLSLQYWETPGQCVCFPNKTKN